MYEITLNNSHTPTKSTIPQGTAPDLPGQVSVLFPVCPQGCLWTPEKVYNWTSHMLILGFGNMGLAAGTPHILASYCDVAFGVQDMEPKWPGEIVSLVLQPFFWDVRNGEHCTTTSLNQAKYNLPDN